MSYDPVEGVNYIFDRYAFLNQILEDGKKEQRVSPASTAKELDDAFVTARAMYHPDRQARSGDGMKKIAEEKTRLIADAERFLLNPELKSFYDAKLAEFAEKKPHLVSTDGRAIISLGETYFDIGALLDDNVRDTSGFEQQVKALMQYDDKRLPQLKMLYTAMPDNAQVKDLYRAALVQEYIYLGFLEDAAWAKVGYVNRKEKEESVLLRAGDYSKRLEGTLQKAKARDIDASIEQHGAVARIGMAKTPLPLDMAPGTELPVDGELSLPEARHRRLLEDFKEAAHRNFEIRAEYVREIAKRREGVLEELMDFTPVEPVGAEQQGQKDFDFYLLNPPAADGSQLVLLRMEMDGDTGNASIAEMYHDGLTLAQLKAQNPRAGFAVTRNAEIPDMMLEIATVSQRFLDKREQDELAKKAANENNATQPRPPKAMTP